MPINALAYFININYYKKNIDFQLRMGMLLIFYLKGNPPNNY